MCIWRFQVGCRVLLRFLRKLPMVLWRLKGTWSFHWNLNFLRMGFFDCEVVWVVGGVSEIRLRLFLQSVMLSFLMHLLDAVFSCEDQSIGKVSCCCCYVFFFLKRAWGLDVFFYFVVIFTLKPLQLGWAHAKWILVRKRRTGEINISYEIRD